MIIVDDGSTDSSCEIAVRYARKDSRIKLYKRERLPKGGSTCRNIGLEHACGKYVIFLDSDDVLAKNCLGNRVQVMEANPQWDACIFKMAMFYEQIGDCDNEMHSYSAVRPLYRFLSGDWPWSITAPLWRRDALLHLGGFDERYPRLQDPELHVRACFDPDIVIHYDRGYLTNVDCYYRNPFTADKLQNSESIEISSYLYFERCISLILSSDNNGREKKWMLAALNGILAYFLLSAVPSKKSNEFYYKKFLPLFEKAENYGMAFSGEELLIFLFPTHCTDSKDINVLFSCIKRIKTELLDVPDLLNITIESIWRLCLYYIIGYYLNLNYEQYAVYGKGEFVKTLCEALLRLDLKLPVCIVELEPDEDELCGVPVKDVRQIDRSMPVLTGSAVFAEAIKETIIRSWGLPENRDNQIICPDDIYQWFICTYGS